MLRTLAVDFNSYFASCEQQERPELRGQPIGIVPVVAETTCLIAASYAAKRLGVRAEMGVREARAICPGLRLIEARPKVYIDYHHRLLAAIESCLHVNDVRSIDEVECGLTSTYAPRELALDRAREIKARVARDIGPCLTASIGIAPNWFLAKLASDMQKPDGLTVIDEADLPQRLYGLQIEDFLGVGAAMSTRLRAAGLDTVEKLYGAPRHQLRGIWGSVEGERFHGRLRGEDIPSPCEKNQTVGHSHVLPPQLRTWPKAHAVLHRLLQKAAMRLRHIGHYAAALSAAITFRDRPAWSDELRLTETQDTLVLTQALNQMLEAPAARQRGPAHVQVRLSRLLPAKLYTPELFDPAGQAARAKLNSAVDLVNQTFGHGSVFFGGAFGVTENAPMRISYTCIPKPEVEEIDESRGGRLRPEKP